MSNDYILVKKSGPLRGAASLYGAKNAALVIMASTLLTRGKSLLKNVPASSDVYQMIRLLEDLGVRVIFDKFTNTLEIDTSSINNYEVKSEIMEKMRASILVMGPLLACFKKAKVALPGGCSIGARPIDFHVSGFKKFGVKVKRDGNSLEASIDKFNDCKRITLEYPSVGATENLLMFATLRKGSTTIVNAALEPEVFDLISVLCKMGAKITYQHATIQVEGVSKLNPIEHDVVVDRLEAGALLLAAAVTGGEITLPNAQAYSMDICLEKLSEMGHRVIIGKDGLGVSLKATSKPSAVSFKTGPYPGFPTDLQAPFMLAQCVADGASEVEETVFENRLMHVAQLQKMGAHINVSGMKAKILGVDKLYGCDVIASDIRASYALILAGLIAEDATKILGLHHFRRAYDRLEEKLILLGANISIINHTIDSSINLEKQTGLYKSV